MSKRAAPRQGRKSKKRSSARSSLPLSDEHLFLTTQKYFTPYGVRLPDLENIYGFANDRGEDRLYFDPAPPRQGRSRKYVHVTPHMFAWHEKVASEAAYNNDLSEANLCPKMLTSWMSTNSELVSIYELKADGDVHTFYDYRTKTSIDKFEQPLAMAATLLRELREYFKVWCICPTVFSPKRLLVDVDAKKLRFFEGGHFQLVSWPVNESLRIVDSATCHPGTFKYVPRNVFHDMQCMLAESRNMGLLNFYLGSVTLIYFCLTGIAIPEKNSKYKDEKNKCTIPNGVCKTLCVYDTRYYDFFHRYYCVVGLRTLPNALKTLVDSKEVLTEFLSMYDEFLQALATIG